MSVKIKVSYEQPEELGKVLHLLRPVIQSTRLPKVQEGRYKRAYVFLLPDEPRAKPGETARNEKEGVSHANQAEL